MSQENVEAVRRLVEAFYARDGETVASVLDAEIEFESALVEHKTYMGMAGMLEYRRDLDDAWRSGAPKVIVFCRLGRTAWFTCIGSWAQARAAACPSRRT